MVEAAVTFALKQLSVLINEEYSLLVGIKDDVEDVMIAFGSFSAVLRVADEREESDPQVKEWVKIIRELVYDTEDVLDELQFRFGGGTGGGFFTKIYTCVKNLSARRRLALELQRVKKKLSKNSQGPTRWLTPSDDIIHNHNKRVYDARRDALLLKDLDLVGIDNPKLSLVNHLLADDKDLRVHSVVGMGGLGKTTLVKKVYDDEQVTKHFQLRVWLTVSETFTVDELLKDAIRQLKKQTKQKLPPDFAAMKSDKLKEFINGILSGQSYIVVLDDIWNIDHWKAIKYSFPRESFGSRIVITTRNSEIGAMTSHETKGGNVYPLESLSSKDSWTLFCRKTFFGEPCPQHLVEISENILKRCGGLPLAIVVIAGVLATKSESIKEWERFQHNLGINNDGGVMKNILSLSYYDLPYYLKYCFLYLSIFPEDVIIEKMRVIRLWIAEGFVRKNNDQQQEKEEVAEGYLNELLHRNLIQIVEKTRDGKMKGFRVHDILREVILSKSEEQNFTITIATGQNTEPSNKFRRLAIHRFDDHILKCTSSKMHLRSLQFFEPLSSSTVSSSLPKMFSGKYIPLKVLDLRNAELEEIPDEVFNLFQLKYLSLRRTKLRSVSKSIGRLQNLETLDLKHTYVVELPVELLRLCKLRHLLVYRYQDESTDDWIDTKSFNAPFKIGELLSLQKLCFIQANDIIVVSEIGKLTQLRRLGVRKLRQKDGKEFCSSFEKLTNLCSLSLGSNSKDEILDIDHPLCAVPRHLRTLQLVGPLDRAPQWLSSLEGLTRVHLVWNRLVEDPLPFFEDLPMLAYLKLTKSYEGKGLCFKDKKFSKLKSLHICEFEALKWIRMEEGTLDHLEEFQLGECKLVEQIPIGIQHLYDLKVITIYDLGDKFNAKFESVGEKSEILAKIGNIPEINISHVVDGKRKFLV